MDVGVGLQHSARVAKVGLPALVDGRGRMKFQGLEGQAMDQRQ